MNLRPHSQVVELYQLEADALCHALRLYHYRLEIFTKYRKLYLVETLSIRSTQKLYTWLSRMQLATWPRDRRQRPKPRRWRLEVDELLILNRLYIAEELCPAQDAHANPFYSILGRVNQKASSLPPLFEL